MSGFAASDLKTRVDEILNRRAAVGLVVGVARPGSPPLFCARGVADIPSQTPVTQDTVFRIGSITKTVTAIAVMQLWEQGLVALDAPANDYLRAFRLVAKRPQWRPATVRHLLTHTAGIPELVRPLQAVRSGWFSETYPVGQPVPTLAEFYRERLWLVAEPGTTFTYTNHTFAALGQIVEDITGQPLDRYFRPVRVPGRPVRLRPGHRPGCVQPLSRDHAHPHRRGPARPGEAKAHSEEEEAMSVTAATELWRLSATELAELISTRQASSREVIEAHLRRIEAVNPKLNAVTIVLGEQALATEAADRAAAAGGVLPPLHGVPFTVKENIDLAGTPTTVGLKALAEAYPDRDAPVVERMRAAGAIPIGRTNCPGMAVRWHTDNELHGPTFNPWDRARTPGASSGGEAAAIASGMSPLGLGSDGLGSLRWPAQCCGVAALKPTLGRIPHATSGRAGEPIGFQLTNVQGPMARRVADLRAALEALAGPTWRDPWSVPAPLRGPALAAPFHVAFVVDPAGRGTAAQVRDGVRKAADTLAASGYIVDEAEPPSIDMAAKTLLDMLNTPEIRAGQDAFTAMTPADTQRFFAAFFEVAGPPDPVATTTAFATRQALLQAWGEFQESHPLIVAPIYTDVLFLAGTDLDDGAVAATIHGMRMAMAVNALGLPAVAVPVGVQDGLPQVVQVIGPRYREDLCLDAAAAIEQRLGTITPIDPRP